MAGERCGQPQKTVQIHPGDLVETSIAQAGSAFAMPADANPC